MCIVMWDSFSDSFEGSCMRWGVVCPYIPVHNGSRRYLDVYLQLVADPNGVVEASAAVNYYCLL